MTLQESANEVGEVNQLLTNLELNPSIINQVARLKELDLNEVTELKHRVESELSRYGLMLEAQNVDMDTNLVTEDGYPRGDIDVLQIRLVRRNVNMLKNDLSNIIEHSYTLLNNHFNKVNDSKGHLKSDNIASSQVEYKIPFALITEIDSNGPTSSAGVQNNDRLISIGTIHAGNHMKLRSLQNEVIQNEDKELSIRVLRENEGIIDMILIPTRNWNGRGLLGCRLQEL